MPITQDRLISLLDTIDDLHTRFKLAEATAERMFVILNSSSDTEQLREAGLALYDSIKSSLTIDPFLLENYIVEKTHFKYSKRSNEKVREAVARSRQRRKLQAKEQENQNELNEIFFDKEEQITTEGSFKKY